MKRGSYSTILSHMNKKLNLTRFVRQFQSLLSMKNVTIENSLV